MSPLPFLGISFAAGAASLLVRGNPRWSAVIAIAGLAGMVATASAMEPGGSVVVGGSTLAGSAYLRLFALLGSTIGLALVLVGLLTVPQRDVPGVTAIGLGAAVLAIALADAGEAVLAVTIGGMVGVLVTALPGTAARGALVGIREIRAVAVAGALAILATAWLARPLDVLARDPAVFGLAYLGFVLAVAIRFGAIPFHYWAARLADAAPEASLPLLMAWVPAAFAAVALAWVDASVAPLLLPLSSERAVIAAIGVVSFVLGIVAAWIQDDLEHVVGYSIVADAGVAILALAALDPQAWEPARTWLLVFVVARSAFAAWAAAIHGAFATRRLPELGGWARRAPILAVALGLVAAASIGWPGFVAWQARATIAAMALPGWIAGLVGLVPLAALGVYARILMIGLARPAAAVVQGSGERPRWPSALPSRPMVGKSGSERAFERASHMAGGTFDIALTIPAAVRLNRAGLTSILVVALAALSVVVSAGGLGVPEAARAVPPAVVGPGPSQPASSPSVSSQPDSGSPAPASGSAVSASGTSVPGSERPSFAPIP